MKNNSILFKKIVLLACCGLMSLSVTACGGNNITSENAEESETETEIKTEAEKSDSVWGDETEPESSETTYADLTDYDESIAVAEQSSVGDESPYYGIMYASVLDINGNQGDSNTVYTFKDKKDPENAWSVTGLEIADIEADLVTGNDVVILFHGDIVNDAEELEFIAVLPDGDYSLKQAEGTTLSNTMSVFELETADNNTIEFIKDNCKMDEDAMNSDSGDKIKVYYADGGELGNFPLRIVKQ